MSVGGAAPAAKKPRRSGSLKGEIYRQSRLWHGWLSAFAFLALIFFSVTGLLLNHPEWFKAKAPVEQDRTLALSPAELKSALAAPDPNRALAAAVAKKTPLLGAYQSGEEIDGQAMIRLEGVKGGSDLAVDLETGEAEVAVTRADVVTTLNELHRGKNAGPAWKLVIDLTAVLVLALSLIGYVLFFTLRFRLRTSLILTGVSLGVLAAVFVFLTP